MTYLKEISDFAQSYVQAISAILEVEVTMVDEECTRISGTGAYQQNIGEKVPHGSFFRSILKTGKPGIISDVKKEFACQKCNKRDKCQELANIGFPIFKNEKVVGVIGIIAFTEEQRKKLVDNMPKLWNFLKHMSELLESKLFLMETNRQLKQQMQEAIRNVNKKYSFNNIIAKNPRFISIINRAKRIAKSPSTVLIRGESGTGKELIARAIHSESSRCQQPFIAVNCAAIPESLLESELFGYEGGTFTGAQRGGKVGKFELAQHGTIFLDEVGDMPLSMQAKLLRVLQEKTIDRIGGKRPIPIDVRVIAATNKDLEMMVQTGKFREDLYYRLNVIPLNIPPLRERPEDIPLLIQYYIKEYCQMLNKPLLKLEPSLEQWLKNYSWPGNIRQLKNVVEYMVNMAKTDVITFQDLPEYLAKKDNSQAKIIGAGLDDMLSEYEKSILKKYVRPDSTVEDKIRVARELKISLATLYRRLKKYKLC